jgi:D-3-phosphoglycerate dehydrogenase / 2-oxoglutarate reductase
MPEVPARALSQCLVVVTPRSFGSSDLALRAELEGKVGMVRYCPGPHSARALAELVAEADGLLAGLDQVSAEVFSAAPRLRVVARYGTGTDQVDLVAAGRCGVTVTTTPGVNANAVAELTVGLAFVLARRLLEGAGRAKRGEWPVLAGVELEGRAFGVIGLGRIGSLVATKMGALGMRVLAFDPNVQSSPHAVLVPLAQLAAECDFISLHAPLTPGTRGMLGRDFLSLTKPGAALINTARGGLVDEEALLWALDSGRLRGAALDVLSAEPASPGHALVARDDVIVLPHMGPHTAEATSAMGRLALDELLTVLSGGLPHHPVVPGEAA